MREAQFTARSANSRGLARNSRRLAVNSFVPPFPSRCAPRNTSRAKRTSLRKLHHVAQQHITARSARSPVPIGACATSFDRLRSTSLTKSHHCCAATHHCAQRTFLAQRTIPFLASRTERQSLPRFCKIPLKKRLKTLRNRIKRRLFVFALFSSFRRFAQLFSIVLVCSADFAHFEPISPCFFVGDVV